MIRMIEAGVSPKTVTRCSFVLDHVVALPGFVWGIVVDSQGRVVSEPEPVGSRWVVDLLHGFDRFDQNEKEDTAITFVETRRGSYSIIRISECRIVCRWNGGIEAGLVLDGIKRVHAQISAQPKEGSHD